MNNETVLKVWMDENVSVGAIARLFETDMVSVEDGIRAELRRLRSEAADAMGVELDPAPTKYRQYQQDVLDQARQTVAKLPGPIDTEEIKHPRRQRAQKIDRPDRIVKGVLLTDYPDALRHPLADSQRAVWDSLKTPAGVSDLERDTGLENGALYQCLMAMRNKTLIHKRDGDGKWERITEVSR